MEKNLCLNCFADRSIESVCPHCGYSGETRRPALALPPGSILQGRYRTGRILRSASNEFAFAYRAIDTRSNARLVVREYFPRELARRLEGTAIAGPKSMRDAPSYSFGLRSFLGEARELRSLFDPHVVPTRHIFEENGTAYIAEDYCEGQPLAAHLDRIEGTFSEAEALRFVEPLLHALESAHNKGLLHLALCPENILVRDTGEPAIVGFAASRIALAERNIALPELPHSCFTPIERYLSTREMGPWTDVYSIAAILYRMLTGIDPPEAPERSEVDGLTAIADRRPDCSPHVATAIALGMQVNRKDRLQAMGEFRRALLPESAEEDEFEPESPSPPSAWAITGRILFGHVAKLGFALGGLAYLTILGYIAFISLTKPQPAPGDERATPPQPERTAASVDETRPPSEPASVEPGFEPYDDTAPQATAAPELVAHMTGPEDFRALVSRANGGTPEDWFRLAKAYENGEGTPRSISKALKWYRQSAEQNLPEAQVALGRIYITGANGRRDRTAGVEWYRRAADQGLADAQFALATLYELGFGVPQNRSEALKLYRLAAENGHAMAQNRLGKIYDEGQGVAIDDEAALDWYRRAAEQGDTDAQFNLALMYKSGEGVTADREEATRWLQRAASGGNGSAKAFLKKLQTGH